MTKARDFPANTCAASRHAQLLATVLMGKGPTWYVTDDRQHSGESIAATVAALWLARSELAAMREEAALWEERARHLGWRDEHGPNVRANRETPRDDA